jgi:predicted RND superfamily exporter protein
MDAAADLPLPPLWLVAGCVAVAYAGVAALWRRPDWVVDHPRVVLGAFLAISLAAAVMLVDWRTFEVRVRLDASEEPLMLRGDPAREVYRLATRAFGNDDVFVVAMLTDGDVFTRDHLEAMRRVSYQVLRLPGVRRAESLVDTLAYRFDAARDWVDVARFIDEIPSDPAELADLRRRALADPIYPKLLVSRDGSAAAINLSFHEISDREFVDRGLDDAILAIAASETTPERTFRFAGRPHVKSRTASIMARDLVRLIPLAVIVAALVVFAMTGSVRGVMLPLLSCLTSVLWTFGLLAWTGTSINLITLVLAPVLISLGGLYGVHIVARWELEREQVGDARSAALATLRHVFLPEFLSGVTTTVGFAALIPGGIPGIEQLGLFAFFGTSMLTLISLAGIPAALALLPHRTGGHATTRAGEAFGRRLDDGLVRLAGFCTRHATPALAAWALVTAIALAALPFIVVDTDYLTFFDPSSDVRQDFAAVNERLIGPVPLYVELRGNGEGTFREPENLRRIEALQRALEPVPGVSTTLSMVDVVRQLNRALERGDPAEERIPDTREEVADLVFMAPKADFRRFANANHSAANVIVRTAELGSRAIRTLVARIEAEVAKLDLEPALDVEVTGNAVVLNRSADALAGNQLASVGFATFTILALVYAVFRSLRFAVLVMVPNVTPVILFFGLLGLGIAPLSLPTSMIGCTVLGVAVDDTIHTLVSYRRLRERGATPEHAVLVTMREVGRPMVISSWMLVAGFLTITVSGFATIREFGWLSALTMVICLVADLVMLPALLVRARA